MFFLRPFLFFPLSLAPVACLAQAPEARIVFDKTHHDFGRILDFKAASHRCIVTNSGSAPLRILELRPSCGCSVPSVGKNLLEPGENTFIEVEFNPSGMQGSVRQSVSVISDDPENPSTLLTFEASAVPEIMPSAPVLFFNKLPRSSSASSSIRLQSGTDQPVAVTEINITDAPYITCDAQAEGLLAVTKKLSKLANFY